MEKKVDPSRVGTSEKAPDTSRLEWVQPTLEELPRLTDLTLQTGNPIPGSGGTGGGGGTVF